jgi:heme oxygenase (biliverdin-IX-beta and delta-forming)
VLWQARADGGWDDTGRSFLEMNPATFRAKCRTNGEMGLIEKVGLETEAFQSRAEEDILIASATPTSYREYLARLFGFVLPSERSILSTPKIDSFVDVRRFQKHELLRRDLMALRMTPEQIGSLPLFSVPLFDTPEEALGWAYLIERSTLRHGELYRHLASVIPGEVAFASSYLKCYLGMPGEMWRSYGHALEVFAGDLQQSTRVLDSAKAAFRCYRAWQFMHDQLEVVATYRRHLAARSNGR